MLALADEANDNGVATSAVSNIAQKARTGYRNTQRILNDLEKSKEIKKYIMGGAKTATGNTNKYHLLQYQTWLRTAEQGVNADSPLEGRQGVNADSPTTTTIFKDVPAHHRRVLELYRLNIEYPAPLVQKAIQDDIEEFGELNVGEAIKEALLTISSGDFGWKYVRSILKRWQKEGRGTDTRNKKDDPLYGVRLIDDDDEPVWMRP